MPVWEEVWDEARINLLAWFLLAAGSSLPALGLWLFLTRRYFFNLFPPRRRRFIPWGGYEVGLVFFVTLLLVPALVTQILNTGGFFYYLYGPDFGATPAAADRRILWVSAFAFPFQVGGILIILRGLTGARLYQLGLTTSNAVRNLLLGWLAWLLCTPPVLVLNILVSWGYRLWEGEKPEEHPLARLAREQPLAIEWVLIGLTGVVMAPILEELLFRRVLLAWAARRPWGGPIILLAAFALTAGKSLLDITEAWDQDCLSLRSALHALEPTIFVLVMATGFFVGERRFRSWRSQPCTVRAIYSTALLFGVFHIWPTPVPLFVLGLVLGYLAYRTQNLIAPMVLHALFNGVACLLILRGYS
jgi:membrane protease YdiL (CAAX protease family)